MTVGVDIRSLHVGQTGTRTVLQELCREFVLQQDKDCHFVFFSSPFPVYQGKNRFLLMLEHVRFQAWKQLVIPFWAWIKKCDIVFCADYFAPYIHLGYQTVQIYHDAFFYEYPEHYNTIWNWLIRHVAAPAARRSAYIMVVSEYSRQRIHHFTGIPLEKLVVLSPGPKTLITDPAKELPARLREIRSEQYILHVGVMEKRKNLPALVSAFRLLTENGYPSLKLVLVGKGSGKKFSDDEPQVRETIIACNMENSVILTGYLPDDEVALMYEKALMYVFPSVNEGFGIPILEAFQYGIPVLVADNTSLPETGGDAVLCFNPFDENDIYAKMKQVLDNADVRTQLVLKGEDRRKLFSWHRTAGRLIDLFRQAATH